MVSGDKWLDLRRRGGSGGGRRETRIQLGSPSGLKPLDSWEILEIWVFIPSIPQMCGEYLREARYFSSTWGVEQ